MKIVVLGAGGMLGSMVTAVAAVVPELEVTASMRNPSAPPRLPDGCRDVGWRALDAETASVADLSDLLNGAAWAVNAIGVIKPYIRDDAASTERAIRVNGLFPHTLARAAEASGCRVLQIATDCVYSGTIGRYGEGALHDALDVYGKTKSLGEVYSPMVHHLRCSIVGPEPQTKVSLLEWFRGQPHGAVLRGFVNHRWNGVTTLHFARICLGIMAAGLELPQSHHLVPTGDVSKKELLDVLAREYRRADLTVNEAEAAEAVDRTLTTRNDALNLELWRAAGYDLPPTVPAMLGELAGMPSPMGAPR